MELSEKQKELYATYRVGDTQYRLAGEEAGCFKLANDFYDLMEQLEETQHILSLHPSALEESRDKLARFLCFYFNGPHLYQEKYGNIQLGAAHAHIPIGSKERDAWLLCMARALQMQPWEDYFKEFLFMRFQTPAHRIQNQP
jgi:hemoglobin